jgi:integrase/recombinase XerD
VSEACNLKKADIDWEKGLICFRDRKNYEDNVLPIVPTVEEALKTPKKINHWELAFCTERGRRYTRQALYATWIKANREAHEKYGIRVMALKNATRHSLASRLVEQGESIPTVARILGNRPSVVEKNYARQRASSIKELLANVDRK